MSGKKLLYVAIVIAVLEILTLAVFGGFSSDATAPGEVMTRIGPVTLYRHDMGLPDFQNVPQWNLLGESAFWRLNKMTTIMLVLIDIFVVIAAFIATRKLREVPGRLQSVFELVVSMFDTLVQQTLGPDGRRHLPMLGSLFIILWISNIIGFIPLTEEPTRDLNVPLGHMLVVLTVVQIEAIRAKGIGGFIKSYAEPFIIMMPLNIIGEIAKGVSLSFRLFGNILGGAIIVIVISYLTKYFLLPVGLNMFFGMFVGTIQAFVFTMLGMTYIAVAVAD